MEANLYQNKARQYANYPKDDLGPYFAINGISAATGNISNILKNVLLKQGPIFVKEDIDSIKQECGDLIWYLSNLCSDLGIKLDDVLNDNLERISVIQKIINKQINEKLNQNNSDDTR